MKKSDSGLRLPTYLFAVTIFISSGLLLMNFVDYIGLLNSMKEVNFSIDEILVSPRDDEIEITLVFLVSNPTAYTRLRFSSLQCQLYLITDGGEEYIGVTAYAPPTDVPLRPDEEASYEVFLSIRRSQNQFLAANLHAELSWRIRCVIHFSTPIRKYYQTLNFYPTSLAPT
jgi:hypothetical protein